MLQNFKKFPELDLRFTHERNILVGDNESGKSTILLALDLVLSDSRHRVEALGVESLLSQTAVRHFQEGERRAELRLFNRPDGRNDALKAGRTISAGDVSVMINVFKPKWVIGPDLFRGNDRIERDD